MVDTASQIMHIYINEKITTLTVASLYQQRRKRRWSTVRINIWTRLQHWKIRVFRSNPNQYVPFIGKVEYGRWLAKITVPWLEISGPDTVTGGDNQVIVTHNLRQQSRESGLGDIVSSITYTAFQSPEQKLTLDVGAKFKFATTSVQKRSWHW